MSKAEVKDLLARFENKAPEDILKYFLSRFSTPPKSRIALASSLGAEDQALTHMILTIRPDARIFVLDTGRLYAETYALMGRTMKQYGMRYEIFFPDASDVEEMVSAHGPDLFYESVENRRLCCEVRKIRPLRRVLSTLDAWITGLRKGQSATRDRTDKIEWDEANGLIKINPLADWNDADVWEYIRKHNVPYSILHDRGYPSIGCAPCTRAVQPGEDMRSGRWWWETSGHKECGLHVVDGNLVRKKG